MAHILNDYYDKVVCINLAERPDKREKMQERFDKLGIEVEWFTAVKYGFAQQISNSLHTFNNNQPNEFGAALSHYTVIKQALQEGKKNIFVFEDDVKFYENFNKRLENSLNELPENTDMILLYSFMYHILPENIKVNKYWMKAHKSWSLVAYGMNEKSMKEYIKRQDEKFTIADMVSYQMQDKLNIYVSAPTLVIPDVEQGSDIRNIMNYKEKPTVLNIGMNYQKYNI